MRAAGGARARRRPGRLVVASSRLEAQLAASPSCRAADVDGGPAAIGVCRRRRRRDDASRPRRRGRTSNSSSASTSRRSAPACSRSPTASTCSSPGRRAAAAATALAPLARRGARRTRERRPSRRRCARSPLARGRSHVAAAVDAVDGSPAGRTVPARRRRRRARRRPGGCGRAGSPNGDTGCSSSPPGGPTPCAHVRALDLGRPPQPDRLLLSSCTDTDGDLLGELLPRHPPLPPARAWPGSSAAAGERSSRSVGSSQPVSPVGRESDLVGPAERLAPRQLAARVQDRAFVDLRRQHDDATMAATVSAMLTTHGPQRGFADGVERGHRHHGRRRDERQHPQQVFGPAGGRERDDVAEQQRQHDRERAPWASSTRAHSEPAAANALQYRA